MGEICFTHALTSCPPTWLNLSCPMGLCGLFSASALKKKNCSSHFCCCVWLFFCHGVCNMPVCICACTYVCAPLWWTEPVCSATITQVVSHCSLMTQTLWRRERKQKRRRTARCFRVTPCWTQLSAV